MLKKASKTVVFFLGYCLIIGMVWSIYSNHEFCSGHGIPGSDRELLFKITIILMFLYGYFSKIKINKSFVIARVIIFLIFLFCIFIALKNKDFYSSIIQQNTADPIKIVPEQLFYFCNLIIEPLSLFIWTSLEDESANYWILLTSFIPVVSMTIGIVTKSIIRGFRRN